jgi:hypothetical protein
MIKQVKMDIDPELMDKNIVKITNNDKKEKRKKLVKRIIIGTSVAAVAGAAVLWATKNGVKPPKVGLNLTPNYDPANDPNMIRGTIVDTLSGKKFDGYWFESESDERVFFTPKDGILK